MRFQFVFDNVSLNIPLVPSAITASGNFFYEKRSWVMIANKTTIHKGPNEVDVSNYRAHYSLQL